MSPIRSPTLVSGVASFSPYRSLRCRHPTAQAVAELGVQPAAARADRHLGVVVDLAAVDDRRPLVEQGHQGADQPGLALAALAEQHDVVAGEQRALQGRQDGLVEPDDALEPGLAGPQQLEQVLADLGLHGAVSVAGGAQLAERGSGGAFGHAHDLRPDSAAFPGAAAPPGWADAVHRRAVRRRPGRRRRPAAGRRGGDGRGAGRAGRRGARPGRRLRLRPGAGRGRRCPGPGR